MSIQGLIDFLRAVQDQGVVAQIALIGAILGLPILSIAWGTRWFQHRYHHIEDENDNLKAKKKSSTEAWENIRIKNQALEKEIAAMQERLPESVLHIVDLELREGNPEIAYSKLKAMFDDLSPGLSDYFQALSEQPIVSGKEEDRYQRLADQLRGLEAESS